jgi:hypothetical protein
MEEKGAHTIIESAQDALGFAILLTGVGTRETHDSTVFGEKRVDSSVIEFADVVRLKCEDRALKLCLDIGIKFREYRDNFRFVPQRE